MKEIFKLHEEMIRSTEKHQKSKRLWIRFKIVSKKKLERISLNSQSVFFLFPKNYQNIIQIKYIYIYI